MTFEMQMIQHFDGVSTSATQYLEKSFCELAPDMNSALQILRTWQINMWQVGPDLSMGNPEEVLFTGGMSDFLHKINIFGPGKGMSKVGREFHKVMDRLYEDGTLAQGARKLLKYTPTIAAKISRAIPLLAPFEEEVKRATKLAVK